MATYAELKSLQGTGPLSDLVEVAVWVKAAAIIEEASPSAERLAWAESVLASSAAESAKLVPYLLAAKRDLTSGQILAASDAAVQAAVDAAVNKLHP